MSAPHAAPSVLVAVTAPQSAGLVRGQLAWTRRAGFQVALLSSPGERARTVAAEDGVPLLEVPMEREISPARDLRALGAVLRVLRARRPDLVNAGTTKAALLVMVGAWLTRVPCRVYTMRGLRLDTERGARRRILYAVERLTCALAHRVVCVAPSLRERAVELGLVPRSKTVVLGMGSSNGVDVDRFAPRPERAAAAAALRVELGIPADAPLVGCIGRLHRDKGLREVQTAWAALREQFPDARLLWLGRDETADPESRAALEALRADPRAHLPGHVADPAPYLHATDVMVLATYREGFPNVLIEAASAARPVVATRITGCTDAVVDGETGLLVPPADADALRDAIAAYLRDPALGRAHGQAARARAAAHFRREHIWAGLVDEYAALLRRRGLAAPPAGGGQAA